MLDDLASEVRRLGVEAGLDAVGIAPAEPFADTRAHLEDRKAAGLHGGMQFTYRNPARSTDPSRTVVEAAALVVGALRYLRTARPGGATGRAGPPGEWPATPGRTVTSRCAAALAAMAGALESRRGTRHGCWPTTMPWSIARRPTGPALGWYGKNTNLLLPGRGSWYVLGGVITDAPLPPSVPAPVEDGCGTCRRCLPACPTGALIAPGVLDARRCLAWLLQAPGPFPVEYRVALGDRIYGCDDCQEVCPVNLRAAEAAPPAPAEPATSRPSTFSGCSPPPMPSCSDRYRRWYIAKREPRYLRRNALVALGQSGRRATSRRRRGTQPVSGRPGSAAAVPRRVGGSPARAQRPARPGPRRSRPIRAGRAGRRGRCPIERSDESRCGVRGWSGR